MALLTLTGCTVDLDRGEVHRDGQPTRLTPKERALLAHLADQPGQFVARATLLEDVWGYAPGTRTHTLATNIYTLRQKLEADPSNPVHLLARWGRGYCLELPPPEPVSARHEEPWIARERLETAVHDALAAPGALVALVGPPGAGKSRLAREIAAVTTLEGGTAGCALESVTTADALLVAVLRGLGQSPSHAATWQERLATVLDERGPTLLVADDTDQLDDDAVQVLAGLPATGLRVLTTGRRRRTGLGGTAVIEVGPLDVPDPADPQVALQTVPARLFVDRSRRAQPEMVLGPAEVPLVARIVEATGGLPLGLELAAAQLRVATLAEVADHVAEHAGSGLRGALERSWAGLEAREREVLAAAAWFRGPFGLGDLAAMCGRSVLEALATLTDHSLIQRRARGATSHFRMLPPVRQFCVDQVDRVPGWRARLDEQHEQAMVTLAERLPWNREALAPTSTALEMLGDLDAARARAHDRGDLDRAGQITVASVSTQLALQVPDRHLAELAETTAAQTPSDTIRARLACLAAEAWGRLHDYEGAVRSLERAATAGGDADALRLSRARALVWQAPLEELDADLDALEGVAVPAELALLRARVARRRHDRDEQLYLMESALDEVQGHPSPMVEMWLHAFLGDALFATVGSGTEALAHLDAAVQISQQLPGDNGRAAVHHIRAILHSRLGHVPEALANHEASCQIMRRLGQRARRMYYQVQLANTHILHDHELERAERLLDEALRYFERGHGHPLDVELARCCAAELALHQGRLDDAQALADQARAGIEARHDGAMMGDALLIAGQAMVLSGADEEGWARVDRAVEVYAEAKHVPAWLHTVAQRAHLARRTGDGARAAAGLAELEGYLATHPRVDIHASLRLSELRDAPEG